MSYSSWSLLSATQSNVSLSLSAVSTPPALTPFCSKGSLNLNRTAQTHPLRAAVLNGGLNDHNYPASLLLCSEPSCSLSVGKLRSGASSRWIEASTLTGAEGCNLCAVMAHRVGSFGDCVGQHCGTHTHHGVRPRLRHQTSALFTTAPTWKH